jgi:hypothetical protein
MIWRFVGRDVEGLCSLHILGNGCGRGKQQRGVENEVDKTFSN